MCRNTSRELEKLLKDNADKQEKRKSQVEESKKKANERNNGVRNMFRLCFVLLLFFVFLMKYHLPFFIQNVLLVVDSVEYLFVI